MPPPNYANHQVLFTACWWLGFFFDLFSYSGLRVFFASDLWIVLQIMPPPQITRTIRCCSQHLMVGVFWTSSPILDLEHFSQVILRIVLQIMPPPQITPTIRCCSQHLMVGVFFFDLFSYSGLRAFFTSDFMNCTTDYDSPPKYPEPSGAVHSIWWLGFFFDLFSYSGLRAFFTSDFTNCTTDYAPPQITPTIRCCSQHLMVGVFLTYSPILDLEYFSQVIYEIVLQIMPPPQITRTIRCCSQHLMVGVFFDLFSYFWT